jgi:hypothetical protein
VSVSGSYADVDTSLLLVSKQLGFIFICSFLSSERETHCVKEAHQRACAFVAELWVT